MTKVNIQNIKVDLARTSNGRYESMASRDDRTSDCPIFGLDIILMYLLNVVHSLFVGYINTDRSTDILCIRDMIYDEHQRGKGTRKTGHDLGSTVGVFRDPKSESKIQTTTIK